ncbi:MAG TPA: hypothetical protein PLB81_13210, partial [Deltaproteobacteria bacterium]|nr:hypothetical protein [Deltaproteobacteria bacterium]
MREKLPRLYLRYSIWFSTLIIVVLIILLALAVYYVRERAIIDLFSTQQAVVARQTAARAEETIAGCEKGLFVLSRVMAAPGVGTEERRAVLKELAGELQGVVLAIVEIDRDDTVVGGYPEPFAAGMIGRRIDDRPLTHTLKKLHERYIGELQPIRGHQDSSAAKAIGIGLPVLTPDGVYNGAVLAILRPHVLIERALVPGQQYKPTFWLMDETDRLVTHPDQALVGKHLRDLTTT